MAAITALSNLGALPTTFALPSSCSSRLNDVYKVFTESPGYYYLLQGPVEQTSCYPSGYNAATTQYYSPARCPTGFTSACQSMNIAGTVSETVITCCPTLDNYVCQSTIEYVWQSTLGCQNAVTTATTTTWTVTQVTDGTTSVTTSLGYTGGMNAYGIKVGFQSTDFRSSTTTTTRKTTTKTTARTTKATTTSTGSHGSSSSSKSKKKSTSGGVIAGIVIGVIAGVAAIASAIWALVRKRNKDKEVAEAINTYEPKDKDVAPAPQIHEMGTQYEHAVELEGSDARSGMTPYTQSQASPSPLSARTGAV